MGDELAMENDHAYQSDPGRAHDTRWVQRAAFDEVRHAARFDAARSEGQVYAGLLELIGRRRTIAALAADAPRSLLPSPHNALLALARGEHFLSLSNFSAQPLTVSLACMGSWRGEVHLAPWSLAWLEREAP
jgi:amylosucrase